MKAKAMIATTLLTAGLGISGICIPTDASTTIPSNYRGMWQSTPTYMYQRKHIKRNMAIPKLKVSVHPHYVKWQFVGYLPTAPGIHYNNKVYKLSPSAKDRLSITLKGHGPFGNVNILARVGHNLHWAYQNGGEFILHRTTHR